MCHPTDSVRSAGRPGPPRWTLLYVVTLPQLAALVAVEVSGAAVPARAVLRWTLALGTFAAMALWLRANRARFDLQDWCECAPQTMTIHVVESRRPLAAPSRPAWA